MTTELALYPFQEQGVEWLMSLERSPLSSSGGILADDMGLGKTAQVLSAIVRLGLKRVLVVTRNSVKKVWRDECEKWAPQLEHIVIDASSMSQEARIDWALDPAVHIVIVNYELIRAYDSKNREYPFTKALNRQRWDLVVFDEAQLLKNRKSHQYKAARLLTRKSSTKRAWYATGTPVENHQHDYWPLLRNIIPGFGSYWRYAQTYCNVEPVYHPKVRDVVERAKALGKPIPEYAKNMILGQSVTSVESADDPRTIALVKAIAPYVLRRTKAQVYPQMPPKTVQRIPVELSGVHNKLYWSMYDKMYCKLPTGELITADTSLAQQTRLLQLACDWQLLRGENIGHGDDYSGPKEQIFLDLVEGLEGRPFVVFSQWERLVSLLFNRLLKEGLSCAMFTGANVETRNYNLDIWRTGDVQALLVTLSAGGVGLDFTHADTAFFLDRSFNPKANAQAEDRLWRHGQTRAVTVYDLYCEGTIEEHVHDTNDSKTHVADNIVDSLEVFAE